jgi:glycosyltransferase involved in cell wall biosynthesis
VTASAAQSRLAAVEQRLRAAIEAGADEAGEAGPTVAAAIAHEINRYRRCAAIVQRAALERAPSAEIVPRAGRLWWKAWRRKLRDKLARLLAKAQGRRPPKRRRAETRAAPETPEIVMARRVRRLIEAHADCLATAAAIQPTKAYRIEPVPERVLYLLHNSLPFNSGGYAIRAHGLLRTVRARGYDAQAVLRPGFPTDRIPGAVMPEALIRIDDVPYRFFTRPAVNLRQHEPDLYVAGFARQLRELCQEFRPAVIHAASFFRNGLAAVQVGAELGIPVIYELRGLSVLGLIPAPEEVPADRQTILTRVSWEIDLEIEAARKADRVLTITGALRDLLVAQGVEAQKITVLPNGVDTQRFKPLPRSVEIAQAHGLEGRFVIGFIGSIVDYEGLDDLALALSLLPARLRDRWRLLVVGDGEFLPELEAAIDRLGVRPNVVLTGRVPHERVGDYYSVCSLVAYPRKPWPICEMISPLKPIEPMAMGIPVIASDVSALREMIVDGVNGWCFPKGDARALARLLGEVVEGRLDLGPVRRAGRGWVEAHRDWRELAGPVTELYDRLWREAAGRAA